MSGRQIPHLVITHTIPTLLYSMAVMLLIGAGTASAQPITLVGFDFTNNNGTLDPVNATTVATGLVPLVRITRVGPNMAAQSHANSFLGNNWPISLNPVVNQDYFSFTMAPNSGQFIDLSSGVMLLNVSGQNNGPTQFVVRSSLDNFATNIAAPFTPPNNNPSPYSNSFGPYLSSINVTTPIGVPIEFRMYAYSAAQTNKQLWLESKGVVNNAILVTGNITNTPEPAATLSVAAFGSGLVWLSRRVRRLKAAPAALIE